MEPGSTSSPSAVSCAAAFPSAVRSRSRYSSSPRARLRRRVPAVGYLDGVGGARVGALPADVRAVAGDHLHARVPPEPPRYGFDRVPLEQVHGPMALEVHQDGSGGVPPPEAEVVHAHDAYPFGVGTEDAADAAPEGVEADEQAQLAGQSRSGLAAQSQCDPLQGLPPTVGAAGADAGRLIQPLGEDLALAGGLVAEELPHPHPQARRYPAPREVGQGAGVVAVDPARGPLAKRTLGCGALSRSVDGHEIPVKGGRVHVQLVGDGEAATVRVRIEHGFPPNRWRDFIGRDSPPKDRESQTLRRMTVATVGESLR